MPGSSRCRWDFYLAFARLSSKESRQSESEHPNPRGHAEHPGLALLIMDNVSRKVFQVISLWLEMVP